MLRDLLWIFTSSIYDWLSGWVGLGAGFCVGGSSERNDDEKKNDHEGFYLRSLLM
jgi:hypothetical protein